MAKNSSFTFKGHDFSLDVYNRVFRQGLIKKAQNILFNELLFTEISTIDSQTISSFKDDHENTTEEYCFLTERRNARLISRLEVDIPENFSDRHPGANLETQQNLAVYSQAVQSFLECLIVAVLASCNNGRDCSDLVNASVANKGGQKRSIFMDASQGRIAGANEEVPSFATRPLPLSLSSLVALYLINVVPFVYQQENMAFHPGNYLFSSGDGRLPWSEERFEAILKREMEERLGLALEFQDFREVSEIVAEKMKLPNIVQ